MTRDTVHPDLIATQKLVYEPNGLICTNITKETESEEYGAYVFEMNNQHIKFRTGKITPTKVGQFVTLWKRVEKGPIQPHDISDPIDFFIVCTRKDDYFGQFIFPKTILCEQGILSIKGKGGKLGIRVYPPWDKTTNRQAQKTQSWQLQYFIEIPKDKSVDFIRVQTLLLMEQKK